MPEASDKFVLCPASSGVATRTAFIHRKQACERRQRESGDETSDCDIAEFCSFFNFALPISRPSPSEAG